MKLVTAFVPNARIEWINEVEAVPATTKRDGNVTINNMGSPGSPGYFDVVFTIDASFSESSIKTRLYSTASVVILSEDKRAQIGKVEQLGADQLPAMYRQIADALEAQLAQEKEAALAEEENSSAAPSE